MFQASTSCHINSYSISFRIRRVIFTVSQLIILILHWCNPLQLNSCGSDLGPLKIPGVKTPRSYGTTGQLQVNVLSFPIKFLFGWQQLEYGVSQHNVNTWNRTQLFHRFACRSWRGMRGTLLALHCFVWASVLIIEMLINNIFSASLSYMISIGTSLSPLRHALERCLRCIS